MRTFKHLFCLIVLYFVVSIPKRSVAAFPLIKSEVVVDSPTVYRGERIYSTTTTTGIARQNNNQFNGYRRPYKIREKEAKLAYIFGLLGLYMYPFAIPALVLGIIAADRRNKYYNKAVWGIVLGALPIAAGIIALIVVLLLL